MSLWEVCWRFKDLFICWITQEAFQTWINSFLVETTHLRAVLKRRYGSLNVIYCTLKWNCRDYQISALILWGFVLKENVDSKFPQLSGCNFCVNSWTHLDWIYNGENGSLGSRKVLNLVIFQKGQWQVRKSRVINWYMISHILLVLRTAFSGIHVLLISVVYMWYIFNAFALWHLS